MIQRSKRFLRAATLLAAVATYPASPAEGQASPATPAGAPAGVPLMAVDELQAGMRGIGYTVVQGIEPVTFDVEIVGVLHDTFPKLDLVVARLTGLGLERSNVVAGMSGSPVYVDDRLVGAVAYRMAAFAHEAIAGIVPIASMLEIREFGDGGPGMAAGSPQDIDAVLAAAAGLATGAADVAIPVFSPVGPSGSFQRINTPLALAGFRPDLVNAVAPLFESLGWTPMLGGASGAETFVEPNLVPGGAVAVQLMRGDVNVAASGTITWADGDRLLAFGHPFLQGGAVDFPMVAASVLTVLSSASDSRKVAVAGGEILGAIRQDRLPGVMGVIGAEPELIPVRLEIDRPLRPQSAAFELISDPVLTPLYVFLGIVNAVQGIDQVYGEGSIELDTRILIDGDPSEIRFGNLFSSQNQAVIGLSSNLASVFGFLFGNEFESVRIREVDVSIALRRDRRSAVVTRIWHDRKEVRPGETVTIGVELRPFRRPPVVETLRFTVPDSAPAGTMTLLVGDAQSIARTEQGAFQPRDLPHLVRWLNSQRRGDRLYLQASVPGAGALVNGEPLPALPPSVLQMLLSDRTRGDVVRVESTVIAETAVPVDFVLSGSHRVELTVKR